ncbi:unnamed protein product [Rotaria sp. Silwood1]|nr:unnamed protein product [Rotaria sp. Silwood1]CAF1211846.1 unnamed protein product [Rotaria sp. Silwood1]
MPPPPFASTITICGTFDTSDKCVSQGQQSNSNNKHQSSSLVTANCSATNSTTSSSTDINSLLEEIKVLREKLSFMDKYNRRLLLTSPDIAVAVMIYKVRRLQNNKDIDSLCKLFNALFMNLFPKSMKAVQQQLHPGFDLNKFYKFYRICSNCGAYDSNSMFKCISCNDTLIFKFYLCSIKQQIQQLLSMFGFFPKLKEEKLNNIYLFSSTKYGEILREIEDNAFTLMINLDGVTTGNNNLSLWPFTVAGRTPLFWRHLSWTRIFINELDQRAVLHFYNIASCSNKPAEALLANVVPYNAEYGCPKCFHAGSCPLVKLKYFHYGTSFLTDSLHTIYAGAFKQLLKLLFHSEYRNESWSLFEKITQIDKSLTLVQTPSTTQRRFRSLKIINKYKGSEYRCLFHFGLTSLVRHINDIRLKNLLFSLVAAINLASSNYVTDETIEIVEKLLHYFVQCFQEIFGMRHMSSNIHSLLHVHQDLNVNMLWNIQRFTA